MSIEDPATEAVEQTPKQEQSFLHRYIIRPQLALLIFVLLSILTPLGIVSVYTAKVIVGLVVAVFMLTL